MVDTFSITNNTYSIDTYSTTGTIPAEQFIDDIPAWVDALEPQETDFLTWVGAGDTGNQPVFNIGSSFLPELEAEVQAGSTGTIVGSASDTKLTVDTGEGKFFKKYDIIRIYDVTTGALHETMLVDSIASDVVTVVRNVDGNGASSTIAATDIVKIESSAFPEKADFVVSTKSRGTVIPQAYQRFVGGADATWKAQNTPTHEQVNHFLNDMKRAVGRAKLDYEKAVLRNPKYSAGNPSTSPVVPSQLGGLPYWIQTNVTNLSGAAITRKDFENEFLDLWESTGVPNIVACLGMRTKRVVNRLLDPTRRGTLQDSTLGPKVEMIETDAGSFNFMTFRNMPEGQIYFLNKEDLHLRTYQGQDWTEFESSGKVLGRSYDERFITAEKSFYVTNEHRNARLHGISLDLADYPDLNGVVFNVTSA